MTNPQYRAIADRMRSALAGGSMGAGGALPTERELCAEYGVSRSTIRKALGLLRDDGWIDARQGSGWTVPHDRRGRQFGTFRLRVADRVGTDAGTAAVKTGRRRPPALPAGLLGVDRDQPLLVVERVTTGDGRPIHRSETWFDPDVSATLDPGDAAAEPPARLLAERGHRLGPADQYAEAVLANRRDEMLLGVAARSAVLQIVRAVASAAGATLFVSLHRHPGPAVKLDIDFPTTAQSDGLVVGLHRFSSARPEPGC